jgi:cobalt-precorrin 5A hydrolase
LNKGKKIQEFLGGTLVFYRKSVFKDLFEEFDVIVAVMASGIVVREICPLLKNKWDDPGVILVDRLMRYAVPLLGGHHGANDVAKKLEGLGLKAVVTTSFEVEEGYIIGIGSRKGVTESEIRGAIDRALKLAGINISEVRGIVTVDIKKSELGLIKAVDQMKLPLIFLKKDELNSVEVVSRSKAEKIGLKSVAEASALYFARKKELILPKTVVGRVTIAIAR